MSSSSSDNNAATAPESVAQAITSFGQGESSLLDVREQVVVALEEGPECAEAIHDLLDEELKSRTLTIAVYGELVGVVGAVVSENVPTEFSDDTPGESVIYRVVGEGTLVLADDGELLAGSGINGAAAEAPAEDDQTRPFGADLPQPDEVPADDIGPGTVLRDRYRLDEEVARGAMGVVYRAVDLIKLDAGAADPQLAVKVVSPEFGGDDKALRAFQNEVANTQHLSHPHIIHLFELDRDGDRHFITMEWLEGESLAGLLDSTRGSSLEQGQAYAIIEQLCDALIYAHEHNVVHADVKPGNVFLLETGEVKLIDFGIAKSESELALSEDDDPVALTPAYASCERLEKATPTPQDDLYSLACMIYRLLAGRRVFGPLTALEAEEQCAEVVPIGGMDDERWAALVKALSFRREDRQQDVGEFAAQFGRRAKPRDEQEELDDTAVDETAELPILKPADEELVAAEELQPDMEVDFAFEEESAEEPEEPEEPELSGIFAAAAAGDTDVFESRDADTDGADEESEGKGDEEIVLETAPAADPVTLEQLTGKFDKDALESGADETADDSKEAPAGDSPAVAEPAVAQLVQEKESSVPGVAAGLTGQQLQLVAGVAGVLLVVGVAALGLFGSEEEAAAPRQVSMPGASVNERVADSPVVNEQVDAESSAGAELIADTAEPSVAEPATVAGIVEPEPVIEPAVEPEPIVEPEPVAEAVVAEAVVDPASEAPTSSEVIAEEAATEIAAVEAVVGPPVVEETLTEEIVAEEAVTQEVVAEEAVAEVAAVDTAVEEQPIIEEPVEPQPAVQEPVAPVFDPRQPVALSELELISYAEPKFPRGVSDRDYDGWVDVEFRVDTDGRPRNIEVIGSNLPSRFEAPSISAVKKWRFEPYIVNDAPVAVYSRVRLRFAN